MRSLSSDQATAVKEDEWDRSRCRGVGGSGERVEDMKVPSGLASKNHSTKYFKILIVHLIRSNIYQAILRATTPFN